MTSVPGVRSTSPSQFRTMSTSGRVDTRHGHTSVRPLTVPVVCLHAEPRISGFRGHRDDPLRRHTRGGGRRRKSAQIRFHPVRPNPLINTIENCFVVSGATARPNPLAGRSGAALDVGSLHRDGRGQWASRPNGGYRYPGRLRSLPPRSANESTRCEVTHSTVTNELSRSWPISHRSLRRATQRRSFDRSTPGRGSGA